jgi:hypothetical protein
VYRRYSFRATNWAISIGYPCHMSWTKSFPRGHRRTWTSLLSANLLRMCITYTSCLSLSNTLQDAVFCGEETTFYWHRRRRGGVRQTSSVPDDQPQHIDCCEDSRYLSSLSAFNGGGLQFANSVKNWWIPPRCGPYRKVHFQRSPRRQGSLAWLISVGLLVTPTFFIDDPQMVLSRPSSNQPQCTPPHPATGKLSRSTRSPSSTLLLLSFISFAD